MITTVSLINTHHLTKLSFLFLVHNFLNWTIQRTLLRRKVGGSKSVDFYPCGSFSEWKTENRAHFISPHDFISAFKNSVNKHSLSVFYIPTPGDSDTRQKILQVIQQMLSVLSRGPHTGWLPPGDTSVTPKYHTFLTFLLPPQLLFLLLLLAFCPLSYPSLAIVSSPCICPSAGLSNRNIMPTMDVILNFLAATLRKIKKKKK